MGWNSKVKVKHLFTDAKGEGNYRLFSEKVGRGDQERFIDISQFRLSDFGILPCAFFYAADVLYHWSCLVGSGRNDSVACGPGR